MYTLGVVERGGREGFKGLVDVLVEFCISSLVIICLVKSFYELEERFLWQVTDNFWSNR